METYQFETTVAKHGILQIPDFYKFENKRVQVVITIKETSNEQEEKRKVLDDFFETWGGFFAAADITDDDRYDYLMEKYK